MGNADSKVIPDELFAKTGVKFLSTSGVCGAVVITRYEPAACNDNHKSQQTDSALKPTG